MDNLDIENIFSQIQHFDEQFIGEQTHAHDFAIGASWEGMVEALVSAHTALEIRVSKRWNTKKEPFSQLNWAIKTFGDEIKLLPNTPTDEEKHRYFRVIASILGMVIVLLKLAEEQIQPY